MSLHNNTIITLGDFRMHNYPEISLDANEPSSAKNNEVDYRTCSTSIYSHSFSDCHISNNTLVVNNINGNINNTSETSIINNINSHTGADDTNDENNYHHHHNDHHHLNNYCRTTRAINKTRIIPYTEKDGSKYSINNDFQSSSAPSAHLSYLSESSSPTLNNSSIITEENYLDDYRVETPPGFYSTTNNEEEENNSFAFHTNTTPTITTIGCRKTIINSQSVSSTLSNLFDSSTMPVKNSFSSTSYNTSQSSSFEDLSSLSDSDNNNLEEDWIHLLFQDGLRMLDIESREWIVEQVEFDQDCQFIASSNVNSNACLKKSTNSQLERTNVSMNLKNLKDYIDWKECKHATHIEKYSKFAKSAGNIQYYKPAQPIIKKSKLSKGVMDFVSSENFGMATMLVCPPLILAHWYAVYQKESIELNSAQYFESEWVFNNREQCLETIAILKSYPKYIQKHINRYSQEELDAVFPNRIVSKSISYDYIRKHGFNIEKVESKTESSTPTFNLKCGSEILIEFISSFQFCTNLIKLFTLMSVSFISRTMALSVNILYEQLRRVNEETYHNEEPLQSSPDGEAILYHTKLIYSQ